MFYDRDAALKSLGLEALPDPIKAKEAKKAEAAKAAKTEEIA